MQGVLVFRDDGVSGRAVGSQEPGQTVLEFTDGSRVVIATDKLIVQHDGTYRIAPADELTIPVVAEELTLETTRVARGRVRVRKRIETREETVDTPVVHEEIVVEHVPVNRLVEDRAPEVREEDGVLIIPLIEELLVVEKRLMVREEIRVSRRRTTTSSPQTVQLRREVVDVEREELDDLPTD